MKTWMHAILALVLVSSTLVIAQSVRTVAASAAQGRQVIMVWNGSNATKADEFDEVTSHEFIVKGTFRIDGIAWPINHAKPATGHFFVSNDVTDGVGNDITIAQGAGDPPQPFHQTIGTDMKCKVGCTLNFRAPNNIRWSVTVWH
jgi:hypothetical protein